MECLFCQLHRHPQTRREPEDDFLAETPSFFVKPGLGHFVEGYTLIITKLHTHSLSDLSSAQLRELALLKQVIKQRLFSIYNTRAVAFEHGDVNPDRSAGCCYAHGHMHILPLADDVDDGLELGFEPTRLSDLGELRGYMQQAASYLFYEDRSETMLTWRIDENLESQFLRKEFARRVGLQHEWNWRAFPYRDKIEAFRRRYRFQATRSGWRYIIAGPADSLPTSDAEPHKGFIL